MTGAGIRDLRIPHEGSSCKYVTVSVGCAAFTPTAEMNQMELLRLADAALYDAKKVGRNCVRVQLPSSPSMQLVLQ
jgi:diguanylate cyclase (GGDEF)-like protein